MALVMNTLPILLHKRCMLNVTLKADNKILWKALLTTELMVIPLLLLKCTSSMAATRKREGKTKGWHLCVEWKDGTTIWERLIDLKESNPVEVDEYAATKILLNTPEFIWWDPYVLQKRTVSIAAVTKHYNKRTQKFGIEVPKSWDDCLKLDKENDNTLWQDAVSKEMKNVIVAFKILNGEESAPPNLPRDSLSYDI
jgi:hypothetical protein